MSRGRKGIKPVRCIAYLSVFGHDREVTTYEKNQLKKIREYTQANNIEIIRICHKDILGQEAVDAHFVKIAKLIEEGKEEGVIVLDMRTVSKELINAYKKVGMVKAAGGRIFSVRDGELGMNLRKFA